MPERFWEIDALRGIAIIMMVVFHFLWDLNRFNFVELSLYTGFWGIFQKTTAGLFLLLVGMAATISYNKNAGEYSRKAVKRAATIFGGGILLTVFTLVAFPEQFIYFGILHLIGVSVLLSTPLVNRKALSLVLGLGLIALPLITDLNSLEVKELVWLGLATPWPTLDYFPIIPWFGVVLLGVFLGNTFYENRVAKTRLERPKIIGITLLENLGRYSLLIYFLHQPILFSGVYLASIALK